MEPRPAPTILLIHPGGLLPVAGGGAARAWALVDHLRASGTRVELVTTDHGDLNEALRARVDRLWLQPQTRTQMLQRTMAPPSLPLRLRKLVRNAITLAARLRRRLQPKPAAGAVCAFERQRNRALEELAGLAACRSRPLAAIATFVWMAPALDRMPPGTLRLLDTIDVQHPRRERAAAAGGCLDHLDLSREDEIRELTRADVLLAIQPEEKALLEQLLPDRPVCLVGHAVAIQPAAAPAADPPELLFVGQLYDPNVLGLRQFLGQVWPRLRARVPSCRLNVCGRVVEAFRGRRIDGVRWRGLVPDLGPFYERARIVVNPVPYGSGLKIKNVEALARGKCLVTTPAGVVGLADLPDGACHVVELAAMADRIAMLLADPAALAATEQAALAYCRDRFSAPVVYRDLLALLDAQRQPD